MRKILMVISMMLVSLSAVFAQKKSAHEIYIEKYADMAVDEMYRSGVPASITLAQGLLESAAGQSELAVKANNHFAIKCHRSWTGPSVRKDDDMKNECFRKYKSPSESYRDHSDFLRYNDRYKFLFELEITDYKGWAHGLKKAGYATDKEYAPKLIDLIERYALHEYDHGSKKKHDKDDRQEKREIPEAPTQIEQARPIDSSKGGETFRFNLSRQLYSLNGVPFVYASEGETYESIARQYNLFLREILKYNDLSADRPLLPGTVVYLQKKKNRAAPGLDKYIVSEEHETDMWEISQRFAVKLSRLYRMNGTGVKYELREGDVIYLREDKNR